MAEALLRRALQGRADDITVGSAGTGAWDGAPVSEGAYLVSLEHGLDLSPHRARLLTVPVVRSADRVLTMASHHLDRVVELGGAGKAHRLVEYAGGPATAADLADPFGSSIEAYRATFKQLEGLTEAVVTRLLSERRR